MQSLEGWTPLKIRMVDLMGVNRAITRAPHFLGPMNYVRNIFFTIYIKKKNS